jgi:pimeloyl-ACP methyl ester carboxylesterase
MDWFESDVVFNGSKLHCYRRGEGQALVLAHGATDKGRCWSRVAERLEDRFDIVAFDARFHGLSQSEPSAAGDGADDLVALVEALELERPAAMGHSMGAGSVSQALARRPDLFAAAVLEDPGWGFTPPRAGESPEAGESSVGSLPGWFGSLSRMSLNEIIAQGASTMPSWDPDELPAWAQSKLQFQPPDDWAAALRAGEAWQKTVERFEVPVLLVCGHPELGAIVTPEMAEEATNLNPRLRAVQLDAGHNVRREDFERFVEVVREFLLGEVA